MKHVPIAFALFLVAAAPACKKDESTADKKSDKGKPDQAKPDQAKPDDCRDKEGCKEGGECTMGSDGKCVAASDADCAASVGCLAHGQCSFVPTPAACAVTSDQDCAKTEDCTANNKCKAYAVNTTTPCDTSAVRSGTGACFCEK